jgi:excisionase family DNA binding protein
MHPAEHAKLKQASTLPRRGFRPNEACYVIGVKKTTLYKLIKEGKITAIKVCGATIITAESIERLLNPPAADAA